MTSVDDIPVEYRGLHMRDLIAFYVVGNYTPPPELRAWVAAARIIHEIEELEGRPLLVDELPEPFGGVP